MRLLLKAFLGGALIIPLVVIFELPLTLLIRQIRFSFLRLLLEAFLVAGLVEEFFKFYTFKSLIYKHKEFDEPYDGIIYAVMISLGFATLENFFYLFSAFFKSQFVGILGTGISRVIFAVPMHTACGAIMGYYFGRAKFSPDKDKERRIIYTGLGLAILAHSLYDFFVFLKTGLGVLFILLVLRYSWDFSFRAIKNHLKESPFK